jgi:nucleoside-diphosphate-sugar epimerase
MNVLVTGATGYIGGTVARALQAAGHIVTGVARTEEKARQLESNGYQVCRADLKDSESLRGAAQQAEGVIHTAIAWGPEMAKLDEAVVDAMLEALEGTGRPFIYTSGVWVMGNTRGRVLGEVSPLDPPAEVAWRPAIERRVLDAVERKIRTVVIRPAMVYGRGGGVPAALVQSAKERGAARFIGNGENHWSFVHVDDLADLYVLALEKAGPGELFIASAGPALRVREVAEAVSRSAGVGGRVEPWPLEEARKEWGGLADGLALDQKVGSTKAFRLLGWAPKGPSVMDEFSSGSYAT